MLQHLSIALLPLSPGFPLGTLVDGLWTPPFYLPVNSLNPWLDIVGIHFLSLEQGNKELCDLHLQLKALLDIPDPTTEEASDEEEDDEIKETPRLSILMLLPTLSELQAM